MPGRGPQGTVLGMFLFIVLTNSVSFEMQERNIGEKLTGAHNAHKVIKNMHAKYEDDLAIAEALKMKSGVSEESEEHLK